MALTTTNAQISVQDGQGAVVNVSANGTITFTPGALVTFALQSTSGVTRWALKFESLAYPSLNGMIREAIVGSGQANQIQIQMPSYPVMPFTQPYSGITIISEVSDLVNGISFANYFAQTTAGINTGAQHVVRACIPSALGAYTNVNGVLTENANGAIGTQDGVTLAVGDLVLLPNGVAASAVDAGIYQVTALGSAGAKFVLTAAPEWQIGFTVLPKTEVLVSEGTLYANTTWVVTNTGRANLVGTASFTFYPRQVIQSLTLVAGTTTITNVPIFSALKTCIVAERTTANTTASTISYNTIGGKTAGALGTATLTFQACVAAGTINNADISTLAVMVTNPV